MPYLCGLWRFANAYVILKSCEAFQEEQTVEVKKWLGALYLIHFGKVI